MATDLRDDVATVTTQLDGGTGRGQPPCDGGTGTVPAGRKPGRLPRGVDAAHLQRDRRDASSAEHQHRHHAGDGQRRFDSAEPAIA